MVRRHSGRLLGIPASHLKWIVKFFPIVYPKFDNVEAEERDAGNVGRSPKDIISKLGGLAGKASGDNFCLSSQC